jgi:hypothetical protein
MRIVFKKGALINNELGVVHKNINKGPRPLLTQIYPEELFQKRVFFNLLTSPTTRTTILNMIKGKE